MEKINCYIIKDLLPLYAEGVLSEDTKQAVKGHLEICQECREDYEAVTKALILPSAPSIQGENRKVLKDFKWRLKQKRIITAVIAVFLTAGIFISAGMAYLHVGAVNQFFTPSVTAILRDIQTDGEWQKIVVGEKGYLNYSSLFSAKEVTVDANSDSAAMLRVSDLEGNIIIDNLVVEPGTSASLKVLERKTDYQVEIKGKGDFILLRFT